MNELDKALSMADENGFVTLRTDSCGMRLWQEFNESFFVWFSDSEDANEDDVLIEVHINDLSINIINELYVKRFAENIKIIQ